MLSPVVLGCSILLQFAAAVLAVRLVRITQHRAAWLAIATAITLMAVRRCITFADLLGAGSSDLTVEQVTAEIVALVISLLMVVGMASIAPLFRSIQASREALRVSEERFRRAIEEAPLPMMLHAEDGDVLQINKTWTELTGYALEDIPTIAKCVSSAFAGEEDEEGIGKKDRLQHVIEHIFESPVRTHDGEVTIRTADDRRIQWDFSSAPLGRLPDGRRLVISMAVDVTQRREAEQAIKQAHDELERRVALRTENLELAKAELERQIGVRQRVERELRQKQQFLEQLLEAHERERQLLAYDIHDGFVQDLTGALMQMESAQREMPTMSAAAKKKCQIALRLVRGGIDEARRMMSGLRPPILDEHGVVAAIEYLIHEQAPGDGPQIDFQCDENIGRLSPIIEGALFRVAQEALTNIRRHSQAKKAEIQLKTVNGYMHLEVRDWGVGFDPNQVVHRRFGLAGIRERAKAVHGWSKIESEPGRGTCISVDIPIFGSPTTTEPKKHADIGKGET